MTWATFSVSDAYAAALPFFTDMSPIVTLLLGIAFGLAATGIAITALGGLGSYALKRGDGSSVRQIRDVGEGG